MRKVLYLLFIVPMLAIAMCSCGEDEPGMADDPQHSGNTSSTAKEVKPRIKIIAHASTKDGFIVSFRVRSVSKPDVILRWGAHSKKTSSPKYTKSSSMSKTYDEVKVDGATEYYYKAEHVGFSPGNYVYFKIEAENSKGDDSATGYVIIKR